MTLIHIYIYIPAASPDFGKGFFSLSLSLSVVVRGIARRRDFYFSFFFVRTKKAGRI